MHRDEILDEVRAARARLLEAAGGDLEGLFAMLKKLFEFAVQEHEGRSLVADDHDLGAAVLELQ